MLIQKYDVIIVQLVVKDYVDLLLEECSCIQQCLQWLVVEVWYIDEICKVWLILVDEVKWGFVVIEYFFWQVLLNVFWYVDEVFLCSIGECLLLIVVLLCFVFWMGGDCDGNFNVIVSVICEVLLLVCWMVVDLYLCDID